ncbi:MAG TPA: hypothetical protein DD734_07955 [Firmicutes bacterium]|nr:hypothetical protein [Bacillota bacterium]
MFGWLPVRIQLKSIRREEVRDAVEICRFEHLSLYPLFDPDLIGFRFFLEKEIIFFITRCCAKRLPGRADLSWYFSFFAQLEIGEKILRMQGLWDANANEVEKE